MIRQSPDAPNLSLARFARKVASYG